ncbi:MAG: TetR/AcrR family transcriptional regulator [Oscillospiraceae bacterium]|nr:TetR/AcrR family transcriptional regulator [Oscillospiraceae bacterium]
MPRPPDLEKRERILTAAIAVFIEKGYQGTTILAIEARAGLASSHIYTYFNDKEHLLVEVVHRMELEHITLSTNLTKKSVELDDEQFVEKFYEAQQTIRDRVRFIASVVFSPSLAHLFGEYDFDYSDVFLPFLTEFPNELAVNTARALMDISIGYFLIGDIDDAKAASLSVLKGSRALLR